MREGALDTTGKTLVNQPGAKVVDFRDYVGGHTREQQGALLNKEMAVAGMIYETLLNQLPSLIEKLKSGKHPYPNGILLHTQPLSENDMHEYSQLEDGSKEKRRWRTDTQSALVDLLNHELQRQGLYVKAESDVYPGTTPPQWRILLSKDPA